MTEKFVPEFEASRGSFENVKFGQDSKGGSE
jgi:hypothetical protein